MPGSRAQPCCPAGFASVGPALGCGVLTGTHLLGRGLWLPGTMAKDRQAGEGTGQLLLLEASPHPAVLSESTKELTGFSREWMYLCGYFSDKRHIINFAISATRSVQFMAFRTLAR